MAAKKKTEAEITEYEVVDAYKKCRSFLANCVEIPIKDGKITVSAEFAEYLRQEGYIK